MKRTYIDASVLIAAFQGDEVTSQRAMRILDDLNRRLVVSVFIRLEVLPKSTYHLRFEEVEFMKAVLESAAEDVPTSPDLTHRAINLAGKYDLNPLDSLHISAAIIANVDEFITLEKETKPICQVKEIKVTSLHSSAGMY